MCGCSITPNIQYAWFIEIFINRLCVYRKYCLVKAQKNLKKYEDELIDEMFREIFFSGLINSWRIIKGLDEKRFKGLSH